MIAHVAEAGEGKGRVVLRLTSAAPSRFAIEAAILVARAFQSEVESLFVEDAQLLDVAALPFVREISLSGRQRSPLSREMVERQMRAAAQTIARTVSRIAEGAEVPLSMTIVRDGPVEALASACAARGPWNVVALSEPFGSTAKDALAEIFASVPGTTGLVVVGPMACRSSGRIVTMIEDIDDFDALLRTARRIHATAKDAQLTLLLLASSEDEALSLEQQARLAVGADEEVELLHARIEPHAPGVAAELIRRLGAGFLIGRFGRLVAPANGDLSHLAPVLQCPFLIVR